MKKSEFNILIPFGKAIIIYNTLWDSAIAINRKDANLWGIDNESDLSSLDSRIANILINKHIIIEDSVNELDIIKERLNKINNSQDQFEIIVVPTLACNFSCWYCYENHNTQDIISMTEINSIISMLCKIIVQNKKIQTIKIQFFGGEPMLCFDTVIKPLIIGITTNTQLNKKKLSIGMTTNGYLLSSDKVLFFKKFPIECFQITIDGNKARHNLVRYSYKGENTYDVIIENIKNIIQNDMHVVLRLNISENTNLIIKDLLNSFEDVRDKINFLHFSIQKVWQAGEEVYHTIDQIVKQIRDKGYDAATYFTNPSSIWQTCYADKKNHLVMNPNGKIFGCTARNFSNKQIEGQLLPNGDIKWFPLHQRRRLISPLDFPSCLNCKILPICIGGCSQHLMEAKDKTSCPLCMDDNVKLVYAKRVLSEKLKY
ncbi:MAG: radical SAM protein [Prevotella sp.]|jgi:uncharacterized protein|nr:radical SAM protein [Prevotella sp.]